MRDNASENPSQYNSAQRSGQVRYAKNKSPAVTELGTHFCNSLNDAPFESQILYVDTFSLSIFANFLLKKS